MSEQSDTPRALLRECVEMMRGYHVTLRGSVELIDRITAHLAAPAPVPVAYVIFDEHKRAEFVTTSLMEAHEHINDAINEHDFEPARKWIVRPVYALPPLPKEQK